MFLNASFKNMYVYHLHQYFSARDYKLKREIMCLSETLPVCSQLRDIYVIALLWLRIIALMHNNHILMGPRAECSFPCHYST